MNNFHEQMYKLSMKHKQTNNRRDMMYKLAMNKFNTHPAHLNQDQIDELKQDLNYQWAEVLDSYTFEDNPTKQRITNIITRIKRSLWKN